MDNNKTKNRQFDIRDGGRDYTLGIRINKKERAYIEKIAKKQNTTKSAVVMHYFSEYKKILKDQEKQNEDI